MSDELKRNRLLVRLDYWGSECRKCAEHHNYSCETGCPHQEECEQAYEQIRQLIQSKPEIDDMEKYVYEKAREIVEMGIYRDYFLHEHNSIEQDQAEKVIAQIISDVKGRGVEVDEEFMQKQVDYIAEYPSYNRIETAFKKAGVKIKKEGG